MNRVKYYIPTFLWLATITLLSLLPTSSLKKFEVDILSFDKLAHIFIYAVLSFLLAWGLKKSLKHKNLSFKILAFIFIIISTYGVLMEILQKSISTGRHFEVYDIIANIIGAFVGLLYFLKR